MDLDPNPELAIVYNRKAYNDLKFNFPAEKHIARRLNIIDAQRNRELKYLLDVQDVGESRLYNV